MPFLTQPFQFILVWDRHQICWLAYPVAWLPGPCSHKETWWWNEEVAEAVREKKKKYGNQKKRKIDRGMQ